MAMPAGNVPRGTIDLCILAAYREEFYRKDVKTVLQERCYACHGALAQKAKLRVDSGENLLKAGVIKPGKPGESELVQRVSSQNDAMRMPPEGHALKPEQIAKLKAWIDHIARAGVTFRYTETGALGLLTGKKVYVFAARGGKYAGTPLDSQTEYIRTFFGFLGMTDVEFVYAEGLAMGEEPKQAALAKAHQQAALLAA